MAAILGLGLNEAAYMAEIVRAGIGSVDKGQTRGRPGAGHEPGHDVPPGGPAAGRAADRAARPPTRRSRCSSSPRWCLVIGLPELTTTAQLIYGRNFQQIPLLIVASIWYLVLTTILTIVQCRLERRLSRERPRPPDGAGFSDAEAAMSTTHGSHAHDHRHPMVEAIGVRKVYGDNEVLKSIDLTVEPGEVVSLLGPSGSGKSTFLRCINHLEALDGGEISVNGHARRLPPRARQEVRAAAARRSPPPGATSAWSSSGSTCSRTGPRWRT